MIPAALRRRRSNFRSHTDTRHGELPLTTAPIPVYCGEFWTAKQRQAARLHEISYRACFKPQLPAFFIERLSKPGDTVYDPFSGRGTTSIEAALLGRQVVDNDINPLSAILTRPRLELPDLDDVKTRLETIPLQAAIPKTPDLSMFYQRDTLGEIVALRNYLRRRHKAGDEDAIDRWIRMVATNRLTGHSKGFFSVYTLPPNQATSPENQIKINRKLGQKPAYRDTRAIILHKSRQLQRGLTAEQRANLHAASKTARCLTAPAHRTAKIADASVQLTVTSPPFLDIVQYAQDNWLRCWFNALDAESIGRQITMSTTVADWRVRMGAVFARALPHHQARRLGRIRSRRSAQRQNPPRGTRRAARHRGGIRLATRYSSTSSASPRPPTSGVSATTRPGPTATGSWCSGKLKVRYPGRRSILRLGNSFRARSHPMFRVNIVAIALFCAVAACSPTPKSPVTGPSISTIQTANQDTARPEITVEKIMRDVVGRIVSIIDVAEMSKPTDWTFEADEFKQVEILERKTTPTTAEITVFMTTRNNPKPDEDAVQVSGKLKLHYQRKGGEWALTTIENLTFRYTVGVWT